MQPSGTFRIDGIIPIIPTPFTEEQQVAWEDMGDLIEFARAAGACAICLPAYASEFYKLSEAERIQLIREAVRLASGRIPVIAQVNYPSSIQAAEVAACSQELGVAAVSTAVPRLFALAECDLYRHFERILSVSQCRIISREKAYPRLQAVFTLSRFVAVPEAPAAGQPSGGAPGQPNAAAASPGRQG